MGVSGRKEKGPCPRSNRMPLLLTLVLLTCVLILLQTSHVSTQALKHSLFFLPSLSQHATRYAYFVPLFDGTRAGSLVTRVSVATFDVDTVEFLDLANPDTPAGSSDADDDVNDASEVRL